MPSQTYRAKPGSSSCSPRYASHRLRLGGKVARWVLVEHSEAEGWRLSPFQREQERTVFLSGVLELWHPMLAMSSEEELVEVPWQELASLLVGGRDWELRYRGQVLLPTI